MFLLSSQVILAGLLQVLDSFKQWLHIHCPCAQRLAIKSVHSGSHSLINDKFTELLLYEPIGLIQHDAGRFVSQRDH